jgi:hypothetical protein
LNLNLFFNKIWLLKNEDQQCYLIQYQCWLLRNNFQRLQESNLRIHLHVLISFKDVRQQIDEVQLKTLISFKLREYPSLFLKMFKKERKRKVEEVEEKICHFKSNLPFKRKWSIAGIVLLYNLKHRINNSKIQNPK